MYTLFVILIVVAALLMIGIVLIQESKGGGLASQFSGYNQIGGVRLLLPILTTCLVSVPVSRRMQLLLQLLLLRLPLLRLLLRRSKNFFSPNKNNGEFAHASSPFLFF